MDIARFAFKTEIGKGASGTACDFLATATGLSKVKVKDAMNKGAVWIGKKKGGLRRLRRATAGLHSGDRIEFYYDEKLLAIKPPQARLIEDRREYSAWHKPAGLMAQGTTFGDHCSLIRQVELFFGNRRDVFLVHRIDREASGLMLVAHTKDAAGRLSELFRNNLIVKRYRVEVMGDIGMRSGKGIIDLALDGKSALTEYEVLSHDPSSNISNLDVTISTGRLHQIRRHLEMIGFPVIGDPKYGKGNKNSGGMRLIAYSLKFRCPFRNEDVQWTIDRD